MKSQRLKAQLQYSVNIITPIEKKLINKSSVIVNETWHFLGKSTNNWKFTNFVTIRLIEQKIWK